LRDPKGKKNESVRRFETVSEYRTFTQAWMSNVTPHVEGPLIIWTNLLGKEPIQSTAANLGWSHCWGEYVWGKRTRESNSGEEILRVVEVALILMRDPRPVQRPADLAAPFSVVAGYDDDGEGGRWGNHPNHKPFSVLEPLIRTFSRPGDMILDCFAGSGSIPSAAQKLERQTWCCELDSQWAEQVTRRLNT
jgi:site-specific DNA-methyltransferase (adenine-specific)